MVRKIKNIAVLGDGGWGTTLGIYLAKKGYCVTLWGAFPLYLKELRTRRENVKFLPGIAIPKEVIIEEELTVAVADADVIILAIPSQFVAKIIGRLKPFDLSKKIIVSVIKGIENRTLGRMSEVIKRELGAIQIAVLSGPTIATEVAKAIPSTAVIATKNRQIAKILQAVFNSKNFRIYTNPDVIGVELGGSLKNVIAIACGVCDGLGFGTNAKAAIVTRGLTEMARLGEAMGANPKTFFGLSGLGDLITTCVNPKSRNRTVGEQLGQGRPLEKIVTSTDMVAEGIPTVKAAYRLSRKHKVAMPIVKEVYNIIYRKKRPLTAVNDLMNRTLRAE